MAKSLSEPTVPKAKLIQNNGDKSEAGSGSKQYKCTICMHQFENLQECLKHELLQHSAQHRPQKTLRQKVNAVLKSFKTEEQQTLHTQLRTALHKCEPSQELSTIFKCYCMDTENLNLVYERIHACLKKELESLEGLQIFPFGSIASGLALRDSDIDLYIEHTLDTNLKFSHIKNRSAYNRINNILHRSSCFSDVIAIRSARVPIIKCKHIPTGFSIDINLSCPNSVHNTCFLRDLMRFDTRLRELMIFLKIWAKQLQIIGRGNMTSYCLITLVVFYLQQPQRGHKPLVPSIKTLQANTPPNLVIGVNYAYDLQANMLPLPRDLTVLDLIKGFFSFYNTFDFECDIIAPYLGEAVSLEQFKMGNFNYPAYHNQLRAIYILTNGRAEPLQTERCICVQDPFSLNHNVAKSITPPSLKYFRKCVQLACNICEDTSITTDGQRFETLLYGIVDRMARDDELQHTGDAPVKSNEGTDSGANVNASTSIITIDSGSSSSSSTHNSPHELSYCFTPGRSELRALAQHTNTTNLQALSHLWVEYYTTAIVEIITEIYRLDIQTATPTHNDKQQRLENTGLRQTWLLSGSVDQWTGRLHQRVNNQTFMEFQRAQTQQFLHERRQNANYAVQLNATLTLNVLCDSNAIEIVVAPRDSKLVMCKKDPLRKFFMMFKCSMQSYNLKERLQELQKKQGLIG